MIGGAAVLSCPSCKRGDGTLDWQDNHTARCLVCRTDLELISFPAIHDAPKIARPQAIVVAEDSTCFFHLSNQAEKICDGCGRFLCAVCAVPLAGGVYCPSCIAAQKARATALAPLRPLYSSIALSAALLPLVICPFTLLSAPVTLGFVAFGWGKPGSLVRGRQRWKMAVAALIALLEICGWILIFFPKLWRHHR